MFSSPVATGEFSKLAAILSTALSQHHLLGFEIAQLEFHSIWFIFCDCDFHSVCSLMDKVRDLWKLPDGRD